MDMSLEGLGNRPNPYNYMNYNMNSDIGCLCAFLLSIKLFKG